MNWDAIAALAELVGACAVFASLVYLALQIRQNTRAVRGSAHEASVARNTTWAVSVGSSPQVAELFVRANEDYRGLSRSERAQFSHLMFATMIGAEATYLQYRRGNLDEELWHRSLGVLHMAMTGPGMRTWWEWARTGYTAEFRGIVDQAMQASSGADRSGPG